MTQEQPLVITCENDRMAGVLHAGDADTVNTGVIFAVGGPQYRVGSHRQFVIMARRLAAAGIPVLRFDFRGMGDSEGTVRSFEMVDQDIRAAVDKLTTELPKLRNVVLLGLCDAASANLMYCNRDVRVMGLILLNPWVRTESGEARAYLRHYYIERLLQKSFWRKVISGNFAPMRSIRDLVNTGQMARRQNERRGRDIKASTFFVDRMLSGLRQFGGHVLLLISGQDLTAQEFEDLCRTDRKWKAAVSRLAVTKRALAKADHTLSSASVLEQATGEIERWIVEHFSGVHAPDSS